MRFNQIVDLFVRCEEHLFRNLQTNDKTLVWAVLGEKNVIPVDAHDNSYVRIRGVYWTDNEEIRGLDNAEYVERGESPTGNIHSVPDAPVGDDMSEMTELEDINGVGSKRAEKLRSAGFTDVEDLLGAERSEIAAVEGIGSSTIEKIEDSLGVTQLRSLFMLESGENEKTSE